MFLKEGVGKQGVPPPLHALQYVSLWLPLEIAIQKHLLAKAQPKCKDIAQCLNLRRTLLCLGTQAL